MIDLEYLREHQQDVLDLLARKEPRFDGKKLIDLDQQARSVRQMVESLRHQKNELARVGSKGLTEDIRARSRAISQQLEIAQQQLIDTEQQFRQLYLSCPNVPQADLPLGGKEANKPVRVIGEKPTFAFEPKNHTDLGAANEWLDFQTAASIAGSNFALYKKDAVALLYTLALMMLRNNRSHGYEPVLPSVLVNEKSLEVASNFPKFKDQVYALPHDKLFLTPTAEVNLANLYAGQILDHEQLPIRMTAWTSCFRREAGTYGAAERGLIRIHQFEKVELFTVCEPEKSADELDRMIACAESILKKLGLHYRVSLLAMQDCSFASARTYDIEVWLPGQKEYYEVSSCSNCTDFQARRGQIRYKSPPQNKTRLVHTLNASSLALPRLMVALMETYQQADGSIVLPDVLMREWIW